jgi:hypothetical protein
VIQGCGLKGVVASFGMKVEVEEQHRGAARTEDEGARGAGTNLGLWWLSK